MHFPHYKNAREVVVTIGRPRRYSDPTEFADRIELYLQCRKQDGEQPTVAGLCAFLGFKDRGALRPYLKRGETFARPIKRARLAMEVDLHGRLIDPRLYRPGLIRQLRNNYGWRAL